VSYSDVLTVWFGEIDDDGQIDAAYKSRWWKKDPVFDQFLRAQFAKVHSAILAGECEDWLADARGRLAYVIVLDQFSRNMFRDTPAMFAADGRAVATAHEGVDCGDDEELAIPERSFLYMPFMHSEDLSDQDRCVTLFTAMRDSADEAQREGVQYMLDYAVKHRDIVKRFGRFPHRNALLGRESTDEEREFLTQPGSSF